MRSGKNGIRLLYVDDERFLHEPFKLFMEKDGEFSVDTVPSAAEALDSLSSGRYDAVVSDYQMPEMDGIALLRKLRQAGNRIPFILFTGRGREEVVIDAVNSGADFYIQKGGDVLTQFAELTHFIRSAVDRRRAEEHLIETERKLSSLFAHIPDAVVLFDGDGHVLNMNAAAERLFGTTETESAGHALKLHDDEATARFAEIFRRTVAGSASVHHDETMKRADGSMAYLSANTTPIRDSSGGISFVACTIRDVTDRTRSQALVRALHDASVSVLRGKTLADTLRFICGAIADIFAFRAVVIFLKNEDGSVTPLAKAGSAPEYPMEMTIRWDETPEGQSPTGRAMRTGMVQYGRAGDADFGIWSEIITRRGYNSVLSLPIRFENEIIGAMSIGGNGLDSLPKDVTDLIVNATDTVGIAIMAALHSERLGLLEHLLKLTSQTESRRPPHTSGIH